MEAISLALLVPASDSTRSRTHIKISVFLTAGSLFINI
jgi:hypothetical protein